MSPDHSHTLQREGHRAADLAPLQSRCRRATRTASGLRSTTHKRKSWCSWSVRLLDGGIAPRKASQLIGDQRPSHPCNTQRHITTGVNWTESVRELPAIITMPTSAPKPCSHPGCSSLVRDGSNRCKAHRRQVAQQVESRRGTSAQRGYGYKWQKAREGYLREHPLCKRHEDRGDLVPATVVDHIKPHRGDMSLFWSRANWQPLCKPCHDLKTATEDGAFGRPGADLI